MDWTALLGKIGVVVGVALCIYSIYLVSNELKFGLEFAAPMGIFLFVGMGLIYHINKKEDKQ